MKRSFSLFVAAVVFTLVGAACGGSTLSDAATLSYKVKGQNKTLHVSRDALLSEVGSIIADKPFATFLKQQKFTVNTDLSADSKLTAIWLSQLIQQQAIDALFASRHVKVTPAVQTQAAKDVVSSFPTADIFPAFNPKFRATLTDRQARSEALLASYIDTSDAAAQAYYRAHTSQFGCPSGRNVSHILVATKAAAQGIIDQLKGGASFATLAKQDSTDKQSGAQGGVLGCLAAKEFVAPFQTAAQGAPFGTPIGPVHSQFGYHVILVTKAPASSFASSRTQVVAALKTQGQQAAQAAVTGLLKSFKVHLDPRFGTWGPVTNSQGQTQYAVTAPTTPTPATSRGGTSTTAVATTTAPGSP